MSRVAQTWLLAFAGLFWAYYAIVHVLPFGPINSDELFFLHMFWMMKHGAHQFVDFYSYHSPAYFQLLLPLLPNGEGVSFVWTIRIILLVVLVAYLALTPPRLWPFLLVFIVFGRLVENRPDTLGLLAFNCAWLVLLRGRDRKHLLIAAALGLAAVPFSGRALVIGTALAGLCIWFARRNIKTLFLLLGVGLVFLIMLGAWWATDPSYARLVLSSMFSPATSWTRMSVGGRIFEIERAILLAMILAALIGALVAIRKDRRDGAALVIAVACAAQLGLIFADPSPYGYVYGWATIPTLYGLLRLEALTKRPLLPVAAAGSAAVLLVLSLSYPLWRGKQARPGDFARLTFDKPLDRDQLRSMPLPQLVGMSIERQDIWNQIAILDTLCSRFKGRAAAEFHWHPVCVRDAYFEWIGLTWTPENVTRWPKPDLIIWGELKPWRSDLLRDYRVYRGFALRTDNPDAGVMPSRPSKPRN